MIKFPSINQYRHVIRKIGDNASFHNIVPPKILYVGSVKLHGTNGGISQENGVIQYQSKNRILDYTQPDFKDHAGFVGIMSKHEDVIDKLFYNLRVIFRLDSSARITIFGEWCGEGIQKGVGLSKLPKMFAIFAINVDGVWKDPAHLPVDLPLPLLNISNLPNFTMEMEIDFNNPAKCQNEMVEITEQVEAECPVAKHFGVSGIGEGVVWTPYILSGKITDTLDSSSDLWFKVKGEKHSVSKVHKLAAVDVEKYNQRSDLIKSLVTENRLEQALDIHLNENFLTLDMKNIGSFLRWVFNDIIKEEADTIEASGFTQKEIGKGVSDIAKRFYMSKASEI